MMNNTISPVLYDFDSLFEIHRINCSMNQDIIEVLKLEAQENPKEKDVTIYTDFIFDTTLSDNMDTLEKFKSCTVYIGSNDENRYGNLNNSTVKFYAKKDIHAKFILISPNKVCLTSANLSWSDWLQEYVFFESEEAYQYLLNAYENYVKNKDLDAIKPNTDDYDPYIDTSFNQSWERYENLKKGVIGQKEFCTFELQNSQSVIGYSNNWFDKLLEHHNANIIITTFTLSQVDSIIEFLEKLLCQGNTIWLLAGCRKLEFSYWVTEIENKLIKYKDRNLCIDVFGNIHAKMILVDEVENQSFIPRVWLSSQNLCTDGLFDTTIEFRDRAVYNYYKSKIEEFAGYKAPFLTETDII